MIVGVPSKRLFPSYFFNIKVLRVLILHVGRIAEGICSFTSDGALFDSDSNFGGCFFFLNTFCRLLSYRVQLSWRQEKKYIIIIINFTYQSIFS